MTYSDSFTQTQMQPTIAMESEQESIQPEIEQPKTTVQGMVEILIDYASYSPSALHPVPFNPLKY
jgi:hypothetical protein